MSHTLKICIKWCETVFSFHFDVKIKKDKSFILLAFLLPSLYCFFLYQCCIIHIRCYYMTEITGVQESGWDFCTLKQTIYCFISFETLQCQNWQSQRVNVNTHPQCHPWKWVCKDSFTAVFFKNIIMLLQTLYIETYILILVKWFRLVLLTAVEAAPDCILSLQIIVPPSF